MEENYFCPPSKIKIPRQRPEKPRKSSKSFPKGKGLDSKEFKPFALAKDLNSKESKAKNNGCTVHSSVESDESAEINPSKSRVASYVESVNLRECNIFHIDLVIKQNLSSKISSLPDLEKDLENILADAKFGIANTAMLEKQSLILRTRIRDLESTFELGLYIHKTADILEKYRKSLSSETSRSFIYVNNETTIKESNEREELISKYVAVAREYIIIENHNYKPEKFLCSSCLSDDIRRSIDDESLYICASCGTEIEILDDTPTFKDADRVSISNRYTYSRRGHFIDAMKKFQGKHNIDSEVLKDVVNNLMKELKLHNLTIDTVTKDHIYMFLSEKKLSSHYDDIHLIFHLITGKPCADFSQLESKILYLFEQQEQALSTAAGGGEGRDNSINVYYKLYKLLQKVKYPCKKGDFYILKTKTKEDEHDEIMKKAWKILGWAWLDTY